MTINLEFMGGAGTVTGSRFLVDHAGGRLLVDCGLYQGGRALRARNWEPFPAHAADLDAVILTHAHLDHTGYLPALARTGFRRTVYGTPDTVALAGIVLPDSGHLQEEEAAYANKVHSSKHHPALPLYTEDEARQALELLRPLEFGEPHAIAGATLRLQTAGHILGSASVVLDLLPTRIVFSGDLGRRFHPLLRPPTPVPDANVVVIESTYGNRSHEPYDEVRDRLARVVTDTVERGGTVVIPAFAVDRTEMVLVELANLVAAGAVPAVPVYVDSPMALRGLDVYRKAFAEAHRDIRPELSITIDPFGSLDLREARTTEESKALNDLRYPCIIVSASGMASGGRVLHHLARLLPDPRNAVALVGFQAAGTRGHLLQTGGTSVKMFGKYVRVRAEVEDLSGFSSHADRDELLDWLASASSPPDQIFVVHGEPDASEALCKAIEQKLDVTAVAPRLGERVRIG